MRRRFFSFRETKKGRHERGSGGGGMWYVKKEEEEEEEASSFTPTRKSCQGGLAQALLNPARDLPKR